MLAYCYFWLIKHYEQINGCMKECSLNTTQNPWTLVNISRSSDIVPTRNVNKRNGLRSSNTHLFFFFTPNNFFRKNRVPSANLRFFFYFPINHKPFVRYVTRSATAAIDPVCAGSMCYNGSAIQTCGPKRRGVLREKTTSNIK